jgi:superfamily II DNA/RNA helicase
MATSNQVPASMLVAIILALAASSDGFTTSRRLPKFSSGHTSVSVSQHTSLFMAAAQNKKGGQQQKKRRFVQHIHPDATPSPPTQQKSQPKVQNDNRGATSNLGSLTSNVKTTDGSKPTERRGNKRIGPPLQTNKSIEDLEAILEKRWGTASAQPTKSSRGGSSSSSGGGDADFVLSFGNDDDVYDDDKPTSNLKGAALLKGGAATTTTFRSKRVVDPWAEEEGLYDSVGDEKKKTNIEDIHNEGRKESQTKQQRYNKQDAILNRVRANQDRLQTKRGGRSGDGNKTFDVPVDISKDFYDEDDEGYESRPQQRKNSLVAPQPVGGKGSMKSSPSKSTSSLAGGIFSGRSVDDKPIGKKEDSSSNREEMEEKKKKPKRKEPQSKPLLDENGNEMFLTLEQAEKIVQKILSSKANDGDDDAASDDFSDNNAEWEDIGITDATLLSNLQSSTMSCVSPLPVQEKACPPILVGNDVLVSTHTGSGKTLAFLAPIAQSLLMDTNNIKGSSAFPKAIIVAPGRELASQIVAVGQTLFAGTDLTISLAIGGTPFARNVENLRKRKPDIVVGTPGRIAELVLGRPGEKKGKMNISGVQTIVLDEFDALLQYDVHKEPTVAVMEAMDRQHGDSLQRVLCSATASDMMGEKQGENNVETYLRPGYAHASVDESDVLVTAGVKSEAKGKTKTSPRVSRTTIHGALHVPHQRFALDAVRKVLNTEPLPQQALIFVDSPRRVDIVIEKLAKMDIIAAPLHGGSSSGKGDRAEVNKALREGYVGCVVCTEIAARGIDAPYLTHVINLDLPTDASHYAHRAGRCGRGGRPGVSVSITCDGREKGVPRRLAEELGITMHNVEARGGKLRIVES